MDAYLTSTVVGQVAEDMLFFISDNSMTVASSFTQTKKHETINTYKFIGVTCKEKSIHNKSDREIVCVRMPSPA